METAGDAHDDRDVRERRRPAGWLGGVPPPRAAATAALLVLLALPAYAQERFLIERIDVQHLVHASADVIRAESRLREGERYDESELRLRPFMQCAMNRVGERQREKERSQHCRGPCKRKADSTSRSSSALPDASSGRNAEYRRRP